MNLDFINPANEDPKDPRSVAFWEEHGAKLDNMVAVMVAYEPLPEGSEYLPAALPPGVLTPGQVIQHFYRGAPTHIIKDARRKMGKGPGIAMRRNVPPALKGTVAPMYPQIRPNTA